MRRLLIAAIGVVILVNPVALQAQIQRTTRSSQVNSLAKSLHIRGAAIVGSVHAGDPRPWTFFATRSALMKDGKYRLPSTGQVLSVGSNGEFHYFNLNVVPTGSDTYRGIGPGSQGAAHIAGAWLRHAGVPAPAARVHVTRIIGAATYIGGTGLCCFTVMYAVHWGVGDSSQFPLDSGMTVYVADAGVVAQVDFVLRHHNPRSQCHQSTRSDAHGVILGVRCFDYAAIAESELSTFLAGHHPQEGNPVEVARAFAVGEWSGFQTNRVALRLSSTTPARRVFIAVYQGTSYRLTLVPAFPRLEGSQWVLVRVEHAV